MSPTMSNTAINDSFAAQIGFPKRRITVTHDEIDAQGKVNHKETYLDITIFENDQYVNNMIN